MNPYPVRKEPFLKKAKAMKRPHKYIIEENRL